MSEIKWIKINTNMFDDEKIKLIETMPESDTILIIWIKLLSQAGKTNASGYIYLNENIPYTDEMLSAIFNRPLSSVRMSLEVFKQFGMIDIDDNKFISIENWEKHQNVDGMAKVKEQTRKRVAAHREKKKLELGNSTGNENVTLRNATEEELELELELDIERDIVPPKQKKPSPPKLKFSEGNIHYDNAIYFHRLISRVAEQNGLLHLVKNTNFQTWSNDMRKMIEIDKHPEELLKEVMDWVIQDPFWRTNILSPAKLRKHFMDLAMKMKSQKHATYQAPAKQFDARDSEIAFQQWVMGGNDPNDFKWNS